MTSTVNMEVAVEPAASYHIGRVKRKLATGVYATEAASCFCGSTSAMQATEKDRYGFDHAMHLCKECGVIYANPRMTKEAYAHFYANEYRLIYDTEDDANDFAQGVELGSHLKDDLYAYCELTPKVVFDIGCHSGAWLKPFADAGAECYGVDYGDKGVDYGQGLGLNVQIGSIASLEALAEHAGKKADLIILNHVLEHVTDLEATLFRIRDLLSDDGVLYVGVPGLYRWDRNELWQNAHVWQFTAETLTYVMECCGFSELHADQEITSLWRKADDRRIKTERPQAVNVRDIANRLFKTGTRFVPQIRTYNKFPPQERKANITAALSRGLPDVTALIKKETGHPAVVIGGGPSVDGYIRTIRNLKVSGAKIVAIERMYRWCMRHDLKPDYVVTMDASEDVTEAFEYLGHGSTHLVAVQCQPCVFDRLKEQWVYLYNTPQKGMELADLWDANDYEQITVVNGGGSVTICAMSMAMLLGMRDIHLFGFDCHVTYGGYAMGIAGVGEQYGNYQVRIGDRQFMTNSPYVSFAQDFFRLKQMAQGTGQLDTIKVYGDSLVTAMSKEDLRGDRNG